MRFISVRDLRGKSAQVWRRLRDEREMIITSSGKPIAILSSVTGERLEEELKAIRRARAAQAVHEMQQESVRRGLDKMTLDDINAVIAKARKERRR